MDFKDESFEVEFTEGCINEIIEIYEYITNNLKDNKAAKKLIRKVLDKILSLSKMPEMYMKIGKVDKLKREYHRMVVKNYVILYTIDFENKKVYISRMIYRRRNYLT